MAVVNENSAQAQARLGGRKLGAFKDQASPLILEINHTEVVAGDATSVQRLQFIPPGMYRFKRDLSFVRFSAFGAARVLDIGWEAYVDKDGTAVAASAAGLNNDIDVSAAGGANIGTALTVGYKDFESRDGVWISSTVAGGTIPAAATIDGHLFLTHS
jgi:hypothetical protein